ncbi:MAG: DUF5683 domain-containing protein [Cyclobacteriaceae bacterium]|nr:DUF5683 domain-containing protein [Cyclobacteriaceae bacterium]
MKYCLLFTVLFWFSFDTKAQDTIRLIPNAPDTIQLKTYADRYNPRKALLYAAVLPGLGQVYNKKYWKLPLVYGGIGVTGYAIRFYQQGYSKYRAELFEILQTGANLSPSGFTETQLRTLIDRYRRERDFMIIIMGGVYILQMIDAHVDAHLKEFDLNPQLKLSVRPVAEQSLLTGRTAGIGLFLTF